MENITTKVGKRCVALASTAFMVLSLAWVAPAGAQTDTRAPEVLFVAPVVVVNSRNPDTARIIGIYRCFGGEPIHLWVSAKQGGPDPSAEGSGATSTSWYDTNIIEPAPVICDGRPHVAVVTVGRYPDKQRLTNGPAWIQFCLVTPEGIVASQQFFGRAVGAAAPRPAA